MDTFHKNIVVLGAGYGGINTVLRLSSLFQKRYHIKIHLVDNNSNHTFQTKLHKAVIKNKMVIPFERIISKKNISFHYGVINKIDLENKKVFLDDETIPFIFIVIAFGSKEGTSLIKLSGYKTDADGRIHVEQYLEVEEFPFVYVLGDDARAMNPLTGSFSHTAPQFTLQQGRLIAQNIFNEIYGIPKNTYQPKLRYEFISMGKLLAAGWFTLSFFIKLALISHLANLINTAIKKNSFFYLEKKVEVDNTLIKILKND